MCDGVSAAASRRTTQRRGLVLRQRRVPCSVDMTLLAPLRSGWQGVQASARQQGDAYSLRADDERPLGGYLRTMTVYVGLTGTAALVSRHRGVRLPESVPTTDLALLGVATYRLSRLISKDAITSPLRARWTRVVERCGPGEVAEEPRRSGTGHAVGELLTCPFCLAQWVATGLVFSYLWNPRLTRWGAGALSVVAVSNALQFAHARLDPE